MRIASSLITLVLSIAACGGDGGGGDSISLDELGAELGASSCAKIFECCSESELMEMFEGIDPPITTVEECEQFYAAFIGGLLLGPAREAVDRGTLVYNADLAGDCIAAFDSLSCDEVESAMDPTFEGCENIFEGQLANEESCVTDLECQSGFCDGDSLDGDPGVCKAVPGEGEPCESFECADGTYCENSGSGSGVCTATKPDGAECTFDDECQSESCDVTCMAAVPECTGG